MYAFDERVESTAPIDEATMGIDATRWMMVSSGAEGCCVSVSVDIVRDGRGSEREEDDKQRCNSSIY